MVLGLGFVFSLSLAWGSKHSCLKTWVFLARCTLRVYGFGGFTVTGVWRLESWHVLALPIVKQIVGLGSGKKQSGDYR